jgi:hypothetical protein
MMGVAEIHAKRRNRDASWPYPDKVCGFRGCETVIHRPLYNQRWCGDCALEAKQEENRRRILSATLSPEKVEAILDENYAKRRHMEALLDLTIEGEQWRDLINFEGLYRISTMGRIVSTTRSQERLVVGSRQRAGVHVTLATRDNEFVTLIAHRLVMLTFCPIHNSSRYQVIHKNQDLFDNRLDNLEWRPFHMIKPHNSKLDPDKVRHIRHLFYDKQMKQAEIAQIYQVNINTIKSITSGDHWGEVS